MNSCVASSALPPQRFRTHSQFCFPGQSATCRFPAAMLSLAWHGTKPQADQKCRLLERSLALSQVWWTDAGPRKAYGCGIPTSFPTIAHFCRMKRLSPTRILRASQRALSRCAFTQNKTQFSTSSAPPPRYSLARSVPAAFAVLYPHKSRNAPHRVSSHSSHRARVRRNHKRLPSSRLIERARSCMPNFTALPKTRVRLKH